MLCALLNASLVSVANAAIDGRRDEFEVVVMINKRYCSTFNATATLRVSCTQVLGVHMAKDSSASTS